MAQDLIDALSTLVAKILEGGCVSWRKILISVPAAILRISMTAIKQVCVRDSWKVFAQPSLFYTEWVRNKFRMYYPTGLSHGAPFTNMHK